MAMTANHLIMEGTTKSWFLKHGMDKVQAQKRPEGLHNLRYQVKYGVGSREHAQALGNYPGNYPGLTQFSAQQVDMEIPIELQSLVSCTDTFSRTNQAQKARREYWNMCKDEVIRKYAPWSTPSSERVAVAPQDAQLFQKYSLRHSGAEKVTQASEAEEDKIYMEHQHDLSHRFDHGAVRRFDLCRETVGPMNPSWMLRMPRSGLWRYVIGRVVGCTLAGTVSFVEEDVWSDCTVGCLLDGVGMNNPKASFSIVGPHSEVDPWSEALLNSYPDPEIAHDGVTELTVTVVAQEKEEHDDWVPQDWEPRQRPVISLFFGLIKLQK